MSAESSYKCSKCGREYDAIPPNSGVCLSCQCTSQESYEAGKVYGSNCFLPDKVGVPAEPSPEYAGLTATCEQETKARRYLDASADYLDLSKLQPAQRLTFYRRVCKGIEYVPVRDYNAIPNGPYTPAYWRAQLKYQKSVAAAVAAMKDHPGGFAP